MPNGAVHARIHRRFRLLSVLASVGSYYAWEDWVLSASVLPGYFLGAMVDPDMDLPRKNTHAKKLWRKTIIFIWMVPWWNLYGLIAQRFLGGHRALLTHLPFISTAMRMLWMMLPLLLVMRFVSPGLAIQWLQVPWIQSVLIGLFLGVSLSDTVHSTSDVIWRD